MPRRRPMQFNSRILITLGVLVFLIVGTYIAIRWAEGYRFNFGDQVIEGNGMLAANSLPQGATVEINNEVRTATDDTIHLSPGEYDIKLLKDGYVPWEKKLKVEKELVTSTNARLFPAVPSLSAITVTGASDPTPSPDGHKIAYKVATGSATSKYGLWVVNLNDNPLRFGSNSVLIAKDTPSIKFSQAKIFWSPSGNEVLAYFNENQTYVLNAYSENKTTNLLNAAFQLPSLITEWQQQLALEREKRIDKLPIALQKLATESATLLYFSPSEEKILYVATASATIPEKLIPPLPAVNSQPQQRILEKGGLYVYDLKEDTNFLLKAKFMDDKDLNTYIALSVLPQPLNGRPTPLPTIAPTPTPTSVPKRGVNTKAQQSVASIPKTILEELEMLSVHYSPVYSHKKFQWFPNSQHLILTEEDSVNIIEYDGTNKTRLFSGTFLEHFAYPWPNGQKLIIMTSLNTDPKVISNLYALDLQ